MLLIYVVITGATDVGEVVAIGVGNTCLSSSNLTTDGRCLIDSYAVTMARRALLKYVLHVLQVNHPQHNSITYNMY